MSNIVTAGSELPIVGVIWHEPLPDDEGGYTVLFSDAPANAAEITSTDDPRLGVYCPACLIEHWPEVGRGLDLARETGEAWLGDDGKWEAG